MRVRSVFVALLAIALPLSAAAAGQDDLRRPDVVLTQPGSGATLQAGDLVEIRWSAIPPEADEVELLLSVDGGRHFSLRLTEELDADSRSYLWRVPNLAIDGAALALRMGIGGREIESAPGPLFRLARGPSPVKALLRWRSDEIWVTSAEENGAARAEEPFPAAGLSSHPERLTASPRETAAFLSPTTPAVRPFLFVTEDPSPSRRETAGRMTATILSRSPLTIPRRI